MNKFLLILVSGLLIVFSSACVPGWREIEDSQGRFKVMVKGRVREMTETQVVDGESYTFHILQSYYGGKKNGLACNVMQVDLKPGSNRNLENQVQSMLIQFWDSGGDAEVIDSTIVKTAGRRTTQYEYDTGYGRYLMRYVVAENSLYILVAGCDPEAGSQDDRYRFLDSFQLMQD